MRGLPRKVQGTRKLLAARMALQVSRRVVVGDAVDDAFDEAATATLPIPIEQGSALCAMNRDRSPIDLIFLRHPQAPGFFWSSYKGTVRPRILDRMSLTFWHPNRL